MKYVNYVLLYMEDGRIMRTLSSFLSITSSRTVIISS